MRETTLPKALGVHETHAYYLQTIRGILTLVPNTCRVIIVLAAYAGLQVGHRKESICFGLTFLLMALTQCRKWSPTVL
jgi:hypothetical protein